MPRVTAEVGSTANSYEVLAKLAAGGMAEIFLARGASVAGVERYVVLKRVLRQRASDAAFVRMFLDEARLAAQLQHPNVAQVYDIGKLGDSYFFTMEYVHGETLRAVIQRSKALQRPIPIAVVLTIIAGAAAGLHHAHDRKGLDGRPLGIVHRDVSPSNLMVSYEGGVKVVDFGVAKAAHSTHETASGTVKGKISYLSPEQCRGKGTVDRRSDLFALGIVMWELLTLERLYRKPGDFENMLAIVDELPRPPSALRPEIMPELDALVLRLLAKQADERPASGEELHAAIEELAVRTGSALSTASLSRFVRDLFGERLEPWLEMRSQARHTAGFTVNGEPIPADLSLPPSGDLDRQFGAVLDLSVHRAPEPTPAPETEPEPAPPPPARRLPLWAIVLVPASVLGVVIGVVLARGGPDVTVADAPHVALAPPPVVDARPPIDAVVAPPPIDAAPAPIVPEVPNVREVPNGPVVVHNAPVVDDALAKLPPHPHVRVPPPSPGEELTKAFQADRYGDVVASCSASPGLVATYASACVLAACHLHDAAHARKWLKSAGAKRASLVAGCTAAGTDVEPPKPRDCLADPLACQH